MSFRRIEYGLPGSYFISITSTTDLDGISELSEPSEQNVIWGPRELHPEENEDINLDSLCRERDCSLRVISLNQDI
jgi:hypothetical protein